MSNDHISDLQREALVLQQIQEQSLQLPPDQLARIDDMCPATVMTRAELTEFLAAPPSDFWAGYGLACWVMRTQISAVSGREF